jgi:primosomal protein N' (replication factor Y)
VARHGAGTERLEHDLRSVFDDGGFPVFRLDADTVAREDSSPAAPAASPLPAEGTREPDRAGLTPTGAAEPDDGVGALLRRFEAADCGVLIGTQMVAKGHDFPDVSLGVVLDADSTLRFPDFRAEERTFALIAQLAGRVGRGGSGRVLVQSIAPGARSILHAAQHDSDGFLTGELERRRALRYPPFSHLIRIVCAASEPGPARAAAGALREALAELLPGRAGADGPLTPETAGAGESPVVLGPAALFRLRGRERQVLVVKAAERRGAVAAVGEAVQRVAGTRVHAGVSFSVDVDPQ